MAKSKTSSSTLILVLAILSVTFCWMYGIVGMTLAILAYLKLHRFKKAKAPKSKTAVKLQWAKVLSIAGFLSSLLFLVYYILVFSYGTFIRFF